jgi:hypothetical protein
MSFPLTLRILLLTPDCTYYPPSVLILRFTCLRSSVISRSKERYYFDHLQRTHTYSQYYFYLFQGFWIFNSILDLTTLQQRYVNGSSGYIRVFVFTVSFPIGVTGFHPVAYRGGVWGFNPPPPAHWNSEVLTKLNRIPSSVENTSVIT